MTTLEITNANGFINPNSDINVLSGAANPISRLVEDKFWSWVKNADQHYKNFYYSGEFQSDIRSRVSRGIRQVIEWANLLDMPVHIDMVDFNNLPNN